MRRFRRKIKFQRFLLFHTHTRAQTISLLGKCSQLSNCLSQLDGWNETTINFLHEYFIARDFNAFGNNCFQVKWLCLGVCDENTLLKSFTINTLQAITNWWRLNTKMNSVYLRSFTSSWAKFWKNLLLTHFLKLNSGQGKRKKHVRWKTFNIKHQVCTLCNCNLRKQKKNNRFVWFLLFSSKFIYSKNIGFIHR